MKTQDQIVEKIHNLSQSSDFFGAQRSDLMDFLDFEHAREFLKEGVTSEQWQPKQNTPEGIKKEIEEYMPFAWEKANDERGLSANRSIDHMKAWLWLLDEDLYKKIEDIEYEHYGKEKLIAICNHFGIDWKTLDNGERTN